MPKARTHAVSLVPNVVCNFLLDIVMFLDTDTCHIKVIRFLGFINTNRYDSELPYQRPDLTEVEEIKLNWRYIIKIEYEIEQNKVQYLM